MMIANFLYIIPLSTSQSLFAEGSHDEKELNTLLKRTTKIIFLLLLPAILVTIIFGNYILLMFGEEYSVYGLYFLQLLAISGVFAAVNYIFGAFFRVQKKIKIILIVSTVGAILTLGLSIILLRNGLPGIGIAWIVGQISCTIIYLICYRFLRFQQAD